MKLLEKHINKCHLAILDNARNQSHEAVRKELQRIFHGLFVFLPAYTPEFAPVEHIIHLVRSHIAANIDNLEKTEIHLLHDALEHYSTTEVLVVIAPLRCSICTERITMFGYLGGRPQLDRVCIYYGVFRFVERCL